MRLWKPLSCVILFVAVPSWITAQTRSAENQATPVVAFVQRFYDWYVPRALSDHNGPAWGIVLKDRARSLAPALLRALRQDFDAQSRAPGEIVGLDFDPFLNSQDPCSKYETGDATRKGDAYLVPLIAVCDGKRNEKPEVIAEVVQTDGSWHFTNVYYPNSDTDLLIVLRRLHGKPK